MIGFPFGFFNPGASSGAVGGASRRAALLGPGGKLTPRLSRVQVGKAKPKKRKPKGGKRKR